MSEEYIIVRANKHGSTITKLIHFNTLKELEGNIKDFFEPACEDIEEVGRIQVVGDTIHLDELYVSED